MRENEIAPQRSIHNAVCMYYTNWKRNYKVSNILLLVLSVCCKRRCGHITTILQGLYWLPIEKQIIFKVLLLTYKCQNGLAPQYLNELLITCKYIGGLRSEDQKTTGSPPHPPKDLYSMWYADNHGIMTNLCCSQKRTYQCLLTLSVNYKLSEKQEKKEKNDLPRPGTLEFNVGRDISLCGLTSSLDHSNFIGDIFIADDKVTLLDIKSLFSHWRGYQHLMSTTFEVSQHIFLLFLCHTYKKWQLSQGLFIQLYTCIHDYACTH